MADVPQELRRYRGTKGVGARELGDRFWLLLHRAFGGNSQAAADWLGYSSRTPVKRNWARLGLPSLGRHSPRQQRRWSDERDIEDIWREYLVTSQAEEYAWTYDWRVPSGADHVVLVPICDVHLGHIGCDFARFVELTRWIARHKRARWYIGGDLFDLIVTGRPGRRSEQFCDIDVAMELAERALSPIASQCVGIGTGNHDDRIIEVAGAEICPPRELAKQLGVPFLGYEFHVRYRIFAGRGRKPVQTYVHYHHHGWGGGRTEGAAYNKLRDIMANTTAELVTMAHLHREGSSQKTRRGPDPDDATGVIREAVQVGVLLPSFLRYRGYAPRRGLPPGRLGVSAIHLGVEEHTIHVRQ